MPMILSASLFIRAYLENPLHYHMPLSLVPSFHLSVFLYVCKLLSFKNIMVMRTFAPVATSASFLGRKSCRSLQANKEAKYSDDINNASEVLTSINVQQLRSTLMTYVVQLFIYLFRAYLCSLVLSCLPVLLL